MFSTLRSAGSTAVVLSSLLLSSLLGSAAAQNNTDIPSAVLTSGSGNDKVVVAVNVPQGTSNDLYFHFEAPSGNSAWAAFGMGSNRMDGAMMFVVYRSQDNQGEPTVSARIGSSHNMPELTTAVNVSVLAGSEVTDDQFIANFHCNNCRKWSSGALDVSSTSAPFIYALGPDETLQSDDRDARISEHATYKNGFTLNMVSATGNNGVPVLGGSTSNNSSSSNSGNTDGNDDGYIYLSRGAIIHGFIMCFAFTIVFPGGYLFLRLFDRVWLHAGIQSFGLLLVLMGAASGISVSKRDAISPALNHPHQAIGLLVTCLILISWAIGLVGHLSYRRTQRPHPIMKGHRVVGPLAILLGFINACIGLHWIGANHAIIGYTVFNLLVFIVVSGLVFMMKKRKNRRAAQSSVAANNFREGDIGYGGPPPAYASQQAAGGHGQNVPMQTFGDQGSQEHGRVEYYNVQPSK